MNAWLANIYKKKSKTSVGSPDIFFVLLVFCISIFGVLMVYNSSVAIAIRDFGDTYHFVREQVRWLGIGLVACIIFSKIDYHTWFPLALPLLCVVLVLLMAVFLPGIGVSALGARRWINFGFFVLQPAELAKLSLVIYLSAWFSVKEKGRILAFFMLLAMVIGLVLLEPDMGTAMILLSIAMSLYFFSGAPMRHFFILVPVLLVGIVGLAVASPYRFARLTTFLSPEQDPMGASYHIRQALLALGSGGWFGVGLGQSRQKYSYLPEANTDSIFAIIGEEVGFVGASIVLVLFLILVWRGLCIARDAPDMFGKLIAMGISLWIGMQVAINVAAMTALVPLTGIPLPLISYGGSSMIILLTAIGIMTNISKHAQKRS